MVTLFKLILRFLMALAMLVAGPLFAQLPAQMDSVAMGTDPADSLQFEVPPFAYTLPWDWDIEYIPGEDAPAIIRERLSRLEKTIPLHYHERVHAFINYFTVRNREYTRMVIRRRDLYFPIFEKYLAHYNLPDELKYLSIIESGLNPRAISRAGAAGLWQFMYFTGRHYRLHIDSFEDQRMDPEQATDAACRYLRDLYNLFNDWELALAAYNAGPGNVKKAIKRSGYKKTFWEIYPHLPRETRSYVPQFVAMVYTMNHLAEHNFSETEREAWPPYDTLQVRHALHLETLAQLTGTCVEDLQRLNPSFVRNVIPHTHKTYTLRVPRLAHELLQQNRTAILDSAAKVSKAAQSQIASQYAGSKTYGRERIAHRVRSGETLSALALQYGVRVADIQAWNQLSGTTIRTGQTLYIYASHTARPVASTQQSTTTQQLNAQTYTVQEGDTLWSIVRKFQGLSIETLRDLNNLKDNKIYPGQVLVLAR